jgi:beta-fructofuranosidase
VQNLSFRRPRLHLTPPSGWLNDPHGVTFAGGRYHLFFQHVPDSPEWRPGISWGHASSPDLVGWTHHPVALAPGETDVGCWSGGICARPGGQVRLFYTSVREPDLNLGAIRTAHPLDPGWTTWRKDPEDAVRAPAQERLRVFRDPVVVPDGDGWRMLVGAGWQDGRAGVVSFVSSDQDSWRYDGPLARRRPRPDDAVRTGSAWECPQLVTVGGRQVLIVSVWDDDTTLHLAAGVGSCRDGRMRIDRWSRLGYGDQGHYAATAFTDRDGEPCLISWLRGIADPDGGWVGALSIPYRVGLVDDQLVLIAHPAIRAAGPADRGRAFGLDWGGPGRPPSGRLALRTADGAAPVELTVDGDRLRVRSGTASVVAPVRTGPVQLLVDGPVLEVCTGTGLIGLPVDAGAGDLSPAGMDGADVTAWW